MKRLLDILLSCIAIIVLLPFLIIIPIWIKLDSTGPVFYLQKRVGKGGVEFMLWKFRTMFTGADSNGNLLTVSNGDDRITRSGKFLRKYKLDELPQLFNVIAGKMSIVGPRPEVRKYVELYSTEERDVLDVLPGITDFASIKFNNEGELLSKHSDPETYYIQYIMPEKIKLNQVYLSAPTILNYFRIIYLTILKVLFQ
jgi:lipopolysaccharide/colanic/teichoic acid biosynthesis glycosyltransferase